MNQMKRIVTLLWKDIKDARWAIFILIAYFALSGNFLYSTCSVVMLTGFPCPACGLTRAAFLLFKLDFAGAFYMHPFIYVVVILVAAFVWRRYVLAIRYDQVMKWAAVITIILMSLYYVWRMAVQFPGDPPMQYYDGSVLGELYSMIMMKE